jgi:hypothetical protein
MKPPHNSPVIPVYKLLILAGLIAVVWLVGLTRCKTSWMDEAAYASRAVNFADSRGLGMAFLRQPPTAVDGFVVDPVLRGTWFKVFGAGIFQNRMFNILFLSGGCLLFYMACGLLQLSLFARLLGMFLLALDSSWVWFIRSGRPDPSALLLISIAFFSLTRILTGSLLPSRRAGWAILCGISDEKLPAFLRGHEAAFGHLGGIPHEIVYDNLISDNYFSREK